MTTERKAEKFEDDRKKWTIYFDFETESPTNDAVVSVRFRSNRNESHFLTEKDLSKLKQDLRDLGKLRIIKQGREFLEK